MRGVCTQISMIWACVSSQSPFRPSWPTLEKELLLYMVWVLRFEYWFDQFWKLIKPVFRGCETGLVRPSWPTFQKKVLLSLVWELRLENWFDQIWKLVKLNWLLWLTSDWLTVFFLFCQWRWVGLFSPLHYLVPLTHQYWSQPHSIGAR